MTVPIVELDHSPTLLKYLIYGEFGAGKTYLCGTASESRELSPVLFVNIDGGELTIRSNKNMMQTKRIRQLSEVEEIVRAIARRDPQVAKFKTVVFDTLTTLRDIFCEELLAQPGRKLAAIEIREWGLINITMKRLVRAMVNLPINVIATAHPRFYYPKSKEENPAADPIECTPDFSRKLHNSIAGMFDSLWYLYEDGGKRFLVTQPQPPFAAKTRGKAFAEAIGNPVKQPNLATIHNTLMKLGGK